MQIKKNLTYSEQFVSNLQSPIFMSGSSFNDLCYVDAVVTRYVLVAHSPCYTKTETWTKTRGEVSETQLL